MSYQEHRETQLTRLLDTWDNLGEGERNTLMVFVMRLYAGQRKFGKLSRDKKKWTYEALEELVDTCVYLSCALESHSFEAFSRMVSDAESEVLREAEVMLPPSGSDPVESCRFPSETD